MSRKLTFPASNAYTVHRYKESSITSRTTSRTCSSSMSNKLRNYRLHELVGSALKSPRASACNMFNFCEEQLPAELFRVTIHVMPTRERSSLIPLVPYFISCFVSHLLSSSPPCRLVSFYFHTDLSRYLTVSPMHTRTLSCLASSKSVFAFMIHRL